MFFFYSTGPNIQSAFSLLGQLVILPFDFGFYILWTRQDETGRDGM